jgi:hypothetical protein
MDTRFVDKKPEEQAANQIRPQLRDPREIQGRQDYNHSTGRTKGPPGNVAGIEKCDYQNRAHVIDYGERGEKYLKANGRLRRN